MRPSAAILVLCEQETSPLWRPVRKPTTPPWSSCCVIWVPMSIEWHRRNGPRRQAGAESDHCRYRRTAPRVSHPGRSPWRRPRHISGDRGRIGRRLPLPQVQGRSAAGRRLHLDFQHPTDAQGSRPHPGRRRRRSARAGERGGAAVVAGLHFNRIGRSGLHVASDSASARRRPETPERGRTDSPRRRSSQQHLHLGRGLGHV